MTRSVRLRLTHDSHLRSLGDPASGLAGCGTYAASGSPARDADRPEIELRCSSVRRHGNRFSNSDATRDRRSTVPPSPGSAGNLAADLYQDKLDETLAKELRERLTAVERAQRRLAVGDLRPLSIESGEPIPDERLEAEPTAQRRSSRSASVRLAPNQRPGRAPPSQGVDRPPRARLRRRRSCSSERRPASRGSRRRCAAPTLAGSLPACSARSPPTPATSSVIETRGRPPRPDAATAHGRQIRALGFSAFVVAATGGPAIDDWALHRAGLRRDGAIRRGPSVRPNCRALSRAHGYSCDVIGPSVFE